MRAVKTRTITASHFSARCLTLLDEVSATSCELVVTKGGRPVARVIPFDGQGSLKGSVTVNVSEDELIAPLDVQWDALR